MLAERPNQKSVVGQAKESEIDPVSALMTLRDRGADIKTLLVAMNENYAVVRYGSEILVANIIGNEIKFMNEQNFHRMFANLAVSKPPIELVLRKIKELVQRIGNDIFSMTDEDFNKTFIDLVDTKLKSSNVSTSWFNWKGRRQYFGRGVVFEPGGPLEIPKDMLNLWRGFGIEPKQGDWSLIRNHILNVVCSGHKEFFDYLIKWMACAVQRPNEPNRCRGCFAWRTGSRKGRYRPHIWHVLRKALCPYR